MLICDGCGNVNFPDGFQLSEKQVNEINSRYQYVTTFENVDMRAFVKQNIDFFKVSADFINTGVLYYHQGEKSDFINKVELITGNVWDRGSDDAVIVVDEETANFVFGHMFVVSKIINTTYGELEIIGVVTSTPERKQFIDYLEEKGDPIDQSTYATEAYIPIDYLNKFKEHSTYNLNVIVRDDNLEVSELEKDLKVLLDIPLDDDFIIQNKERAMDVASLSNRSFFQIIFSVTAVFTIIGLINLINVSTFNYNMSKRTIAIYKVIGFYNKQLIKLSILEGVILGLVSSIISIVIGFIVVIVVSLIMSTFVFINLFNLLLIAALITATTVILVMLVNLSTCLLNVNKSIGYYFKGEML